MTSLKLSLIEKDYSKKKKNPLHINRINREIKRQNKP